jgi:predicted cytidylate kinase
MTTITISGLPGSGKSTVAEILKKKLNLDYIYSGNIFRKMAIKYNMNLDEFGKYCEKNKNVDEELDKYQLEMIQKGNIIVEGRISGWLAYRNNIPSMKIFLQADLETRAGRIIKREKGDFEKRKKEILERERSESNRYNKYYNINLDDISIYDLVINTSDKLPEEIVKIILDNLKK